MENNAPKKFEVTNDGVQEIVNVINELVPGKYSKQTVFNVLNQHLKPVQEQPKPQAKEVRKMPVKQPVSKKK